MTSTYIDHLMYTRSPSGLESASLLGNSFRLSGAHTLGATSLTITPATTVDLAQYDQITIFDGPNSEVVMVAADTPMPATSLTLVSGLTFAHAGATPCCTDGPLGSLADQIINASAWLETICQQSLFQATYTNETLRMPGMRASIDQQCQLNFRPRHFPITAENGITLITNNSATNTYDATQCIIAADHQIVSVPWLVTTGNNNTNANMWLYPAPSREQQMWLQITYTAGYTPAQLPADVRDAAVSLVSVLLSRRQNPTAADIIILGDKRLTTNPTNTTGESNHYKHAMNILKNYTIKPF